MMDRRSRRRSSLFGCLHLLLFIGFAVVVVRCDFSVGPSNQAVVAGERMQMECRVSNGSTGLFKWALTRPKSDRKQVIFRVTRRQNGSTSFSAAQNLDYSVDKEGSGIIFKNSTDPEDAGIYFCYDYPGQMQFSAHLIVFESEPLCHFNRTSRGSVVVENASVAIGDEVSMTCQVNYRGLWRPSVEWRRHTVADGVDGGKVVDRDASIDISSAPLSSLSSLSSSLDAVVDSELTTCFSFRLFFTWPDYPVPVNASNVPDYRYEWRSPDIARERPRIEQVVQVIVETVTSEAKSTGDWYVVSFVLLVVVPAIVFTVAAVVVRWCYISYRRTKGLDKRPPPAKNPSLDGLERPASGEYDVIPYAAPNIYDRIDEGDTEALSQQQQQQQQQKHPPLTQCYSHLSDVELLPSNPYDALTPYLSMESTPNSPWLFPLPEISLNGRCENRYTEMGRRGNVTMATTAAAAAASTKDNYLTLVGEGEASEDIDDESDEDAKANSGGDYLIPFV